MEAADCTAKDETLVKESCEITKLEVPSSAMAAADFTAKDETLVKESCEITKLEVPVSAMAAADFTAKDEALVKEAWEIMKLDVPRHSIRLATILMEIAPEVKNLFSFMRGPDAFSEENLPKVKAHAVKIFTMTCESAAQLREKGVEFKNTTVNHLGNAHFNYHVLDEHFEAVKTALLGAVEDAVGEKWSPEMKNAWSVAYDRLAGAIKAVMKVARDNASSQT